LAASSGPSRGGPQGGTHPLLLAAPPGTGAAAAGPRDGVCAAAAGVQRVTSKWLHLSSSRVSSDFQVVALTPLSVEAPHPTETSKAKTRTKRSLFIQRPLSATLVDGLNFIGYDPERVKKFPESVSSESCAQPQMLFDV